MLTLIKELTVRQVNMALLSIKEMLGKSEANTAAQIAELEARVAALEAAAGKT